MNDLELKKSLLSCPGDSIQEHIDHIGMSQAELAERLGRSKEKLNELIKGKAPISTETAMRLENVLGVDAIFWINLERIYQDELLEIAQLEFLEQCKEWLKPFPLTQMRKIGIIPKTTDKREEANATLKFFGVATPNEWSTIYEGESLAFKIELKHTAEPQAISVWLRLGELQAKSLQLAPFDRKKLSNSISRIQEICYKHEPTWMEDLQAVCASFGVALVYTPCISKAPIYGASRWVKNKTIPLIQLTDRKKDYNAFWFSFFHELAHIRYHNKSDIFIEGLDEIKPDKAKEEEADNFAARMLLSEKERNELANYSTFNVALIRQLSSKFQKHTAIIVGQLQREKKIKYNDVRFNSMKVKVAYQEIALH